MRTTFINPSKSYKKSKIGTECEMYQVQFDGGTISSRFPICTLPKTPWKLTDQFHIYTDGTENFMMSNVNQSLRYFANDNFIATVPLRYIQDRKTYEYEHWDKTEVAAMLDAEASETSGEYLGELEIDSRFWGIMKLMIKKGKDAKFRKPQLRALRSDMAIECRSQVEKGVRLYFRINTKIQTEYGGFSEAEVVDSTGELKQDVIIQIRYEEISSLYKLARFGRAGATVRITRSISKAREAVLVWSSPLWDGSALTKAEIVNL